MVAPLLDPMLPVELSPEDIALAEHNARFRQESKDKAGVIDRKYSSESGYIIHLRGCKAEIAFARTWNLPVHQLDTIAGDGGGHDYVLVADITVSVKGIAARDNYVRVFFPATRTQWPIRADLVVAYKVADEGGLVTPMGFQTRQWLTANAIPQYSWRGPAYFVFVDRLRPISELAEVLLDVAA
jgi:hypothetical protein